MDELIKMFRECADRLEYEKPFVVGLREAAEAVVDAEKGDPGEFLAAFDRLKAAVANIREAERK